jgi:quercetin dioxygenase-like cupin family protein
MLSKKTFSITRIVISLSCILLVSTNLNAADTLSQILTDIDQILKENPLKPGDKSQMIPMAQDDSVSIFVLRSLPGSLLKPHLHKTHDETVYVIRGKGQIYIDGQWVDTKPGVFHFNPKGKVHASRNTSDEPIISIAIFTPGMKEPDRHFVEQPVR